MGIPPVARIMNRTLRRLEEGEKEEEEEEEKKKG